MSEIQFPCCFCGELGSDHGLALVGLSSGNFEQQWWCHTDCLLERMVRQARSAYKIEFPDDEEPEP